MTIIKFLVSFHKFVSTLITFNLISAMMFYEVLRLKVDMLFYFYSYLFVLWFAFRLLFFLSPSGSKTKTFSPNVQMHYISPSLLFSTSHNLLLNWCIPATVYTFFNSSLSPFLAQNSRMNLLTHKVDEINNFLNTFHGFPYHSDKGKELSLLLVILILKYSILFAPATCHY